MPDKDPKEDGHLKEDFPPPEKASPKIDLKQLAELEERLIEKAEKRLELKKLDKQAEAEISERQLGSNEQVLLVVGAALMLFSLPFVRVFWGTILAVFTTIISLIAGFTSPKQSHSPALNLWASVIGLVLFEFAALISSRFGTTFWLYQLLAFIFLLATYFSAKTYRKRILEGKM